MNALIAQVAVAVIPNPVPIIMEMLSHQGLDRSRAAPQIVVHRLRDRLLTIHLTNAVARFVAKGARHGNLAQLAGMEEIHRFADAGGAANLSAGLADAIAFPGRLDDPPPFADVMTDRLLHVHVFAGFLAPTAC